MPTNPDRNLRWQMFGLSCTALFLEMMVIRWVPSVVHLVAYYANLMLLSSFLGLGAGALAAEKKWNLFDWFPVLLAGEVGTLLLCRDLTLVTGKAEARFFAGNPTLANTIILVGIFAVNALTFAPLGQRMGRLFDALPRLPAYTADLAGSLCGTLCFGLFSLKFFSPIVGMTGVMLVYLAMSVPRRWLLAAPCFGGVLAMMLATGERTAIWSPYYYITVNQPWVSPVPVSEPPPNLRTMRNPPVYGVNVNQFGYHYDVTLDLARFDVGTPLADSIEKFSRQYFLPYVLGQGRGRVLVVGAGGGADVEAALRSGVRHVDAVEIDPAIVQISRRFNSGAPYDDPRVTVHIDDARAFFARATPGYDLVIFGYLDSQALSSSMSNIRLDGFVYTVESLRTAYGLLNDRGTLSLSFFTWRDWLAPKLYRLMEEATGQKPALYQSGAQTILCVSKDKLQKLPVGIYDFKLAVYDESPKIDPPTDDWPFLYLQTKTIPGDYLIVMASLLALSVAAVAALRGRRSVSRGDLHFALLGMGFLLLETKSISDCTLYFGATWFVTLLVITGVLLMVMAANLVAARLRGFNAWLYAPLLAALVLVLVVPRGQILVHALPVRVLWTLLVVPLPVFFAGIIFSTTFRASAFPAAVFGTNLIGAMLGGFCEYFGMAIGSHRLTLLLIVVYLGSLVALLTARRLGRAI